MEKKYIIVTKKDGKPIDDKQYTKEEFSKKAYELMKATGLDRETMDKTYDYKEVSEGGVSTEQNTGAPQAANDEFNSKEDTSSKYEFSSKNDVHKANITNDVKGWNSTLDKLDSLPEETSNLVNEYKKELELIEGKKGRDDVKKNAIRVLYLYNEFMKFYDECVNGNLPTQLVAYLRVGSWGISQEVLDRIKKDMADIIKQMLKDLRGCTQDSDPEDAVEEFYDEIGDFDEEIKNIHNLLEDLSDEDGFARQTAETDDEFAKFCGGKPTGEMLSKYLMGIATKKYHLVRIKLNSNDPNSNPTWWNPEKQASNNVRLSDNEEDYLNLKNKKILDAADQKKVDEIKNKFMKGGMSQKDAQNEINEIVKAQRDKIKTSLKIFFGFMGINDPQKMNQFAGGLKRLDETEYKNNWIKLIENYKEAMKKNIEKFKQAHSNDMSAEDRDDCVNKLSELLGIGDKMLEAANNSDSTALLSHATQICTCIAEVQKKTAEAKKAFGGA